MAEKGTNLNGNQDKRNRKFRAFLLVFLFTTALLAFNRLSGEQYTEMVKWVFGLFMAGNGGLNILERR
jgi:hypothetical protein